MGCFVLLFTLDENTSHWNGVGMDTGNPIDLVWDHDFTIYYYQAGYEVEYPLKGVKELLLKLS